MTRLNYLPSFEDDATALWGWIAEHDPQAADRMIERLYRRCLTLQEHPLAGPARHDIAMHCRHLVIGPVLILYRYHHDQVDLVRALHGRRKITADMFAGELE